MKSRRLKNVAIFINFNFCAVKKNVKKLYFDFELQGSYNSITTLFNVAKKEQPSIIFEDVK